MQRIIGSRRVIAVGMAVALVAAMSSAFPAEVQAQEAAAEEHQQPGAAGAESEGEGAGHQEGPPLSFTADLAFWSLVVFLVFFAVLTKYAWKPLAEGLDQRESRIRQELTDAEQARLKAQQMLDEHRKKLDQVQDEVREIIAEARRDADHTKQDIIETAQREAEATRNRALREINQAKESTLEELFSRIADEVTEATERVLGRSLTEADQSRLVEEALADLPRR